jgi:hypothetical protein
MLLIYIDLSQNLLIVGSHTTQLAKNVNSASFDSVHIFKPFTNT